jgi:hypothetical protein
MDTQLEELFENYDAILEAKKKVTIGESIDPSEFFLLFSYLEMIRFELTGKKNNRRGFPYHRRAVFGMTRKRYSGKVELSKYTINYPLIYEELERIGKKFCPFPFTSIHVNKNVTCPRHKDEKNKGKSMLVSFGDYTGCKIVVEGVEYDADCTPVIFNGFLAEHWNTDDLEGTKYSLIYYNI